MSGFLFPPKGQNTTEPRLNGIQINQSVYGSVIPLGYGMQRIPGSLIWYGAFTPTAHTTRTGGKGGGGSRSTSYTYTAAAMLLLAEGPIRGLGTIWSEKDQKTLADLGLAVALGSSGPAVWSFLTTNYPTQAIGYDHSAYVYGSAIDLGSSAALPNLTFEAKLPLPFNAGVIEDAEPSAILVDYCTDPNHGCGFPYLDSGIQGAGVLTYESYCIAMGFFLSPWEDTQRPAAAFIAEILLITNSAPFWSGGKLKIVPYADASVTGNGRTYTPNLTPLFTFGDDDFIAAPGTDPVICIPKPQDKIYNRMRVEYKNRANSYNPDIAEATDANDIALNGERPAESIRMDCIALTSVARQAVQLALQRQMFYRNRYQFSVRADYSLLEPMDVIAFNEPTLGLNSVLARIIEVTDSEDDVIQLLVEELPVGPGGAPVYNWELAQGYAANFNFAPGNVNTPAIFMAPQALCQTPNQSELWVAVSGASTWGGCYVWISLDGTTYRMAATVTGPARHGTLTANIASNSGVDPDSTNTLAVLLANTALSIAAGTTADADNLRTLLWVDGEIMSFRDATLTGTGAYNLAYLRRGKYGSGQAAHLSGTKWARLDSSILRIPLDPGMMGQTIYLKFQSFNTLGKAVQDLSGLSAYTKLLPNSLVTAAGTRVLTTAGVQCVGSTLYKLPSGSSAWNEAAYSADSFTSGVRVSWRPGQKNADIMIGLNSDPTADANYTSIDYAIYCNASGNVLIYENGSLVLTGGAYSTSDFFAVEFDGNAVTYFQNGTALRRVARAAGIPLFMDSSFYTPGAVVCDVNYGPIGNTGSPDGNFLNLGVWKIGGSGTQGNFVNLGTGTNSIVLAGQGGVPLGPYGGVEALWQVQSAGGAAAISGGWEDALDLGAIDSHRSYRMVAWVYRNASLAAGTFFHEADTSNTSDVSAGGPQANPYFVNTSYTNVPSGKWLLFVGYVHGEDYTGADLGRSGIYDPVTGTRIVAGAEFRNTAGVVTQRLRSFLYGETNTAGRVWYARPRIDVIDGREPTLAFLMSPNGALAYLNTVGTPQIDANAVTDVASATNASTDVYTSGTTPTQVLSVAVGSYPYATEMIVTAAGRIDHNLTAGHQSSTYATILDATTGSTIGGSDTIIARNPNTTDTRTQQSYALEKRYQVPASTSKTFYLYGQGASISAAGSTCLMLDSLLKVEVIKR